MNSESRLIIGQYIPGNSIFHNLHPVLKIILLFLFCVIVFQMKSIGQYFVFLSILLFSIFRLKVTFKLLLKGLSPLIFLLVLTFCIHLFSTDGTTLFTIMGYNASSEGFLKGSFYFLRILTVVLASSLLTLTTSSVQIVYALNSILKPLKKINFPSSEFALMLGISLRFVPVLMEELEKIKLAQISRGAKFHSKNPKLLIQAWLSLLVPLFHSSLDRADQLAIAMDVRGYDPSIERGSIHQYKWKMLDIYFTLLFLSLAIVNYVFVK
ncbi:MAG: energy-coupling factor transporter transmembrane protein EcfT [Candidatus Cloacimonetes bacterium]|nr:energy-coupling factor transporter transmembrane protein EcfT [Candidatus Cloacimonadota bacterium]